MKCLKYSVYLLLRVLDWLRFLCDAVDPERQQQHDSSEPLHEDHISRAVSSADRPRHFNQAKNLFVGVPQKCS
jgi:hypothetical protein